MRKVIKLVLLLGMTALLTACPGKKDNKSQIRARGDRGDTTATNPTVGQNGQLFQSTFGVVYDNGNGLQQQVKNFISASDDPNTVGYISGAATDNTGVRILGNVETDVNGNATSGQLEIIVYDSYYAENGYDPITISMTLSQGKYNSNGTQLVFSDSYGTVTINGRTSGQYFEGTISFNNSESAIGGSPLSGVLGDFQVQECGFFHCQ